MTSRILAMAAAGAFVAGAQAGPVFTDVTPTGSTVSKVVVHPLAPRSVLVATEAGFRTSADGGATWSTPTGPQGTVDRVFATRGRPGVVFVQMQGRGFNSVVSGPSGGSGDTYRSDDFGLSWTLVKEGANGTRATAISPFAADPRAPEHLYAATRTPNFLGSNVLLYVPPHDQSVVESFDGGRTWSAADRGLPKDGGPYDVDGVEGPVPGASVRLFFASVGAGAYVSHDGARNWQALPGAANFKWIRQDPARPLVLYGWSDSPNYGGPSIVRSEDGADTWRTIYGVPETSQTPTLAVDATRPDRLWLSGLREGVQLSEDRGQTWTNVGFSTNDVDSRTIVSRAIATELATSTDDIAQVYVVSRGRLYRGDMAPRTRVAVEYQIGDRYWITGDRGEAISQDYRGNEAQRTGVRFGLWGPLDAPARAQPICRFQGRPAYGQNSRFIATAGAECEVIKRSPEYALEGEGEYFALAPDAQGGCGTGTVPVRRFYNEQFDSNHRYTTDPAIASVMRARGWNDEGVVFCGRTLGENE